MTKLTFNDEQILILTPSDLNRAGKCLALEDVRSEHIARDFSDIAAAGVVVLTDGHDVNVLKVRGTVRS